MLTFQKHFLELCKLLHQFTIKPSWVLLVAPMNTTVHQHLLRQIGIAVPGGLSLTCT